MIQRAKVDTTAAIVLQEEHAERQIEAADAARQEAERTRAEEAAAAAAAQATTQRLKQDLASAMHALEMEKRQRAAELAQATADRTAVQEQLAAMRANEQNMETEKTAPCQCCFPSTPMEVDFQYPPEDLEDNQLDGKYDHEN